MNSGKISRIEERAAQFVVGRDGELALLESFLSEASPSGPAEVWNLYGTAGVGKSTLLDAYRLMTVRAGGVFVLLDSRDFAHTGEAVARQLLAQLPERDSAQAGPVEKLTERCLSELHRLAATRPVVIAFDTYEEMAELDGWLREQLLAWLPNGMLVLLSGRTPLRGVWVTSAAWRERVRHLPLRHLDASSVTDYLLRCGIADRQQQDKIWLMSKGHPLTLSLAASAHIQEQVAGLNERGEWFAALADLWLREVPDPSLRRLVEAASVMRHFNQELLAFVLQETIADEAFDRLIAVSFCRKAARGWLLHDLMREAAGRKLSERTPRRYAELTGRCVRFFADKIAAGLGQPDIGLDVAELFYYSNDMVRMLAFGDERIVCSWEPLTSGNMADARRYIDRRYRMKAPVTIEETHPVTGEILQYAMDADQSVFPLASVELEPLVAMEERAAMLLRAENGEVVGFAAIVPINRETLPYLLQDRYASNVYFGALTGEELQQLAVPAPGQSGWFIRTIDIYPWDKSALRHEVFHLMCRYLCSGGLFVASPPPLEFMRISHQALGFEVVPGLVHTEYDGMTPTPVFVIDTRGDKLQSFLQKLMGRFQAPVMPLDAGVAEPPVVDAERSGPDRHPLLEVLTEREFEVASLVKEGLTNGEIAKRLFISEITVKKHLGSIFGKMGIKNRGQLLRKMLEG